MFEYFLFFPVVCFLFFYHKVASFWQLVGLMPVLAACHLIFVSIVCIAFRSNYVGGELSSLSLFWRAIFDAVGREIIMCSLAYMLTSELK